MRQLASNSFCLYIRDGFEKFKGSKLSNIFDLNYSKIKNISIANLVCSCVLLFYIIVFGIILLISEKCPIHCHIPECLELVIGISAIFFIILGILSYIARFILSIILFYFIEKGDIEKYDEFLDCKNINKTNFNQFSDITKLRNCCIAFLILNIIAQSIDQIEKCGDFVEKYEESENKEKEKLEMESQKQKEINKAVSSFYII